MFNFDDVTKENIKEHNLNWAEILDYPYRLITNNWRFWIWKNKFIIYFIKLPTRY